MAERRNPFTQTGFSKYEGIHRMPSALVERAVMHEINRQRVVGSLLLDMHLMAIMRIIPKGFPVTLRGAISQNLEGSGEHLTQAAHCAPRQVYIGTETVQQLLQKVFPERGWVLDVLFAETDILPVNFNICDSRAERNGLNEAFRQACQHAISSGHNETKIDMNMVVVKAQMAFSVYRNKGAVAYLECINRLKDKLKPKYLFPKESAKWMEQLQITEQYADALQKALGKDQGISRWKAQGLIKIYQINNAVNS